MIKGIVYKLTNTRTCETYIGSTCNFDRRMKSHRNPKNKCASKQLFTNMNDNIRCDKLVEQKFINRNKLFELEGKIIRDEYRTNRDKCINIQCIRNRILQNYINHIKKKVENTQWRKDNRKYWSKYFKGMHCREYNTFVKCNHCNKTMRILSLKAHNNTQKHKSIIRKKRELGLDPKEFKVKIKHDRISLVPKI
jgi:predicted GIY-YIG superfamily endonuclease